MSRLSNSFRILVASWRDVALGTGLGVVTLLFAWGVQGCPSHGFPMATFSAATVDDDVFASLRSRVHGNYEEGAR